MTLTIVVMIIIGIIFIFSSFFISEKLTKSESNTNIDFLTVNEDYEFSERELQIIKNKIEDVIALQAKDILYETNDSLSSMANEKTLALGDYAVTVCDEIERNHKEVMFLYSMLDDKQKEIMGTVNLVDGTKNEIKELMSQYRELLASRETGRVKEEVPVSKTVDHKEINEKQEKPPKNSALEQLESLKKAMNEEDFNENVEINTLNDDERQFPSGNEIQKKEDISEDNIQVAEEDLFSEIDNADINFDEFEEEFDDSENSNEIILEMYKNGNSILDIAKQLGLGVGEVRLVIDLYKGE